MISILAMEKYVASLTTLSTPHYGSKLSSKLMSMPKWCAKLIAFFVNVFYKIFKDENPDILKVGEQLTTSSMEEFNRKVLNSSIVYYQSYSASLDNNKSFLMIIPHKITKYLEKCDTDGIVSVTSSQWGEYKGNIDKNFDHAKMVGAYGSKKSLNEVSSFYLNIIKDLKEKEM